MSASAGRTGANALPPLALTMGEPAGIGGELALKAWRLGRETTGPRPRERGSVPPFFVLDDPARLEALGRALDLEAPVAAIDEPERAAEVFFKALPVLPLELPAPVTPGRPDPANAPAVLRSIERAVSLTLDGRAAAVVTNPIHKKALYEAGFSHPGHTEFLADLAGIGYPPVMMLLCPDLRVVPVTVHLPLSDAAATLSTAAIVHAGRVTAAALTVDFGIGRPRLAVAGLNPHAGEGGALGREESEIIAPAVEELRQAGIEVQGPLPADSLFHAAARRRYDAALCMYHDQALIPLKTLDFERGVNTTLGLPFVRTSPDHGTALNIAGTGRANPASLIAALQTAQRMASLRQRAAQRSVA